MMTPWRPALGKYREEIMSAIDIAAEAHSKFSI
jgi:hypothetical protein